MGCTDLQTGRPKGRICGRKRILVPGEIVRDRSYRFCIESQADAGYNILALSLLNHSPGTVFRGGDTIDTADLIYRDLQRHLDRQAVGFPATKAGAEIRILKRLFSPDEARLALHITYKPMPLECICDLAEGSGIARDRVESMLDNMARNGAIEYVEREGTRCFRTIPLIVGMFEYQLNRLTPEFLDDFEQYTSGRAFGLSFLSTERPQMRTIPVGKSIGVEHHVATYDDISEIINGSEGPFGIIECICRKSAAMMGNSCKKTSRRETCMPIGEMAKQAIQNGMGRAIRGEEALEIAWMNEAEGLVFQPSNAQKADFICACCGCCCGMLRFQKMLPRPVDFWATNYHATVSADNCTGCKICVERCQVAAVTVDNGGNSAVIDLDRCIGCGNCIVTCPAGAMSLVRKKKETVPPTDTEALHDEIMAHKKGTIGRMMLAAKLMLKR
ncbi:MAG: 4Fe-4S dicluster domain-containing protein [bacterium]|nr:MAG: 4Fe-4S dicluster domain-containing protein [bacterium]